MSVLAFGQTGQVARELARLGVQTLGRADADLSDPQTCADVIVASRATAIVNAAAYTAVDRAEEEEALAHTINADAPAAMAQACAAKGIPLVHISTDYVFDGSGSAPFTTDVATGPLGAYGRTKLAGEDAVRASGAVHGILRTSWVFSAHGGNFVKTMLRLGADRDALTIVADQIGGPTSAASIASACVRMADALQKDAALSGTYHFSGGPDVSWANFARAIFDEAGLSVEVTDIPSADYPTPAARPLNSRLDCSATTQAFGIARPDWRADLRDVLADLHNS